MRSSTAETKRRKGRRMAAHCGVAAVALWLLAACVSPPPNPNPLANAPLTLASAVDLQRFMGRWYVIANIPYFGERGYVGSYVEYAQRPDGDIDDLFFGHKGSFDAPLDRKTLKDRVVRGTNNARWGASPIWPVSFPYLILYVDPDYRYALIGYPDRRWGWVFARSPQVDDPSYRELLVRMYTEGYDTSRFRRVPQDKGQIGQPGFQ